MIKSLGMEFERAIRFLVVHMPPSDENSRKPVLFHNIRVGVYLYENGYKQDVVLAGVLHDTIEWSLADEQMLRNEFGDNVTRLVLASTNDDSITDKEERKRDLIKRCVSEGEDALIIKTADTIDSFRWYSVQGNKEQLEHCIKTTDVILEFKPEGFKDKIFDELKNWRSRF